MKNVIFRGLVKWFRSVEINHRKAESEARARLGQTGTQCWVEVLE